MRTNREAITWQPFWGVVWKRCNKLKKFSTQNTPVHSWLHHPQPLLIFNPQESHSKAGLAIFGLGWPCKCHNDWWWWKWLQSGKSGKCNLAKCNWLLFWDPLRHIWGLVSVAMHSALWTAFSTGDKAMSIKLAEQENAIGSGFNCGAAPTREIH